jgi:hypothetical protein
MGVGCGGAVRQFACDREPDPATLTIGNGSGTTRVKAAIQ